MRSSTTRQALGRGAQGGWHPTRGKGRHGRPRRTGRYARTSRQVDFYGQWDNGVRTTAEQVAGNIIPPVR